MPEISLHAIASSLSPKTMRVNGKVKDCSVIVLVDTGSTHNFLDPMIVRKVGLDVEQSGMIEVRVANGERINGEAKNTLFAKKSKCTFACGKIEYLGHLVSAKGVKADLAKIKAMLEWPLPKSLKSLRGFLSLTGNYRRFVKGYGSIAGPFTNLLKKDAFNWRDEASKAFENLKKAVTNPPILALPDFSKPFLLECDASGRGISVVIS
ncbi:uncharacterized mitochondrial protein AtMg00860-like [Juglans microcarpa x Juglans regia]|uniref:uncharacterized mitochondrial protein AtMg00860-like n=1 Tax=Juglans microcarpa x Juglans regia TaxID=2249226 RepID=UPI001B7F54F1|nr:uncharacterized mitochondrial protein AtMg00860-like [Juglans microcarpa x Juglans regia]